MEQQEHKEPVFKLVTTSLVGIVAVIRVIIGIVLLVCGCIFTLPFALTFFVLPCGFFAWEFYILSASMCKRFKIIANFVAVIVFVIYIFFAFLMCPVDRMVSYEAEEALEKYELISNSVAALPSASELGQTEKIESVHFAKYQFIFIYESDYLICQYNPENYQQQKENLQQRYLFQESIIDAEHGCLPTVSLGDYEFKLLSLDENRYDLDYPKRMVFIGTNDKLHEIVYLSFRDADLDYIESKEDFLLNDCGWEYVR